MRKLGRELEFHGPNPDLDADLRSLQSTIVEDMSAEQKKQVIALANEILTGSYQDADYRQRVEAAMLLANLSVMLVGTMDDEKRFQFCFALGKLVFLEEREVDLFELPMLLEIAEAQETLALSISEERVGGVDIQEELLYQVEEKVELLRALTNSTYDEDGDEGRSNDDDVSDDEDLRGIF